ncbi:mechanosensitive ion channel protein [Leminorella grimontii]|uniref:Mechanosensitive ion channel protein n=1 Tax=Leminorella grimontii TaxID=82981 RepID=A0AAV5MXM1_9GAMM|nr:DUF3772 domain-containing protein [Leminorella grimontii]KFC96213.1 potassium efflux system protein/small-conductance mechanosensitive channel [Leminorella grimontii ATCC 33999 = DSM 5078]GKX54598.1 mechanosensitive ion channel protein [Leminorella grimontii]VFS58848.1 Potassium efflux system KefA precursor [Leminorella grimontii]
MFGFSIPRTFIVSLFFLFSLSAMAQGASTPDAPDSDASANVNVQKQFDAESLVKLQQHLNDIKQGVSVATTDKQLSELYVETQELIGKAEDGVQLLHPALEQVNTQLDVVGAPPAAGAPAEAPEVARQRRELTDTKAQMVKTQGQLETLKADATNLSKHIVQLRRSALKTQLALNSGSIMSWRFWAVLFTPQQEDLKKFNDFNQQWANVWNEAWQPGARSGTVVLGLLALAFWAFGRRLLERGLVWLSIQAFPDGRLRRSFLALGTVTVTVFTLWGGARLIYQIFEDLDAFTPIVEQFSNALLGLTIFSALVVGLGRALLSIRRPSWRLIAMPDPIANALQFYPPMLAALLMAFGSVEQVNTAINSSVPTAIFGNGIIALLIGLLMFSALYRVRIVRRSLLEEDAAAEVKGTIAGLIYVCVTLVSTVALLALLIGYISLARFLSYELVWVGIVLSVLYLAVKFVNDLCESLFSLNNASGKWIKQTFNLNERYLDQATILFSAIGKTVLLLLAIVALFNGTYGTTTPITLVEKIVEILGSDSLGKINIVPANLINAAISLTIGIYILRTARRWLSAKFLPKTAMDAGMRMSLVTLFSNVGYVLLILITLSILGIEWNKLAWIVSALSVGIGFGLQEIVKNFISGLILLTERPVKVGDLVSISGVEGDIRRINVRATEIQLSDKSTVIVPNSQLISQNVRNVTMGNAQGVATIALTFPLDIDPEQVRDILIEAYSSHELIFDTPGPSVTFSQLTPDGITLSVTGYVSSPRLVSRTKSDLLYEILKRLRAAGVKLSSPQSLVLQRHPQDDVGIEHRGEE